MTKYTFEDHTAAIRELAHEVLNFHTTDTPFRINHGSTNSTRCRESSTPQLNIAHLNHILDIDATTKIATVEPNVPLDLLVTETLKKNLMPLVVMEFPGITVGGGFSGASGESSGWKEGLFDCSINEIEIILGNGDVKRAVKKGQNSDLFNGARCSLGTLGVVTLLTVQLTEAKGAVQLSYLLTSSVQETIDSLARLCDDEDADFDFIEGILYSEDEGVIILGRQVHPTAATTRHLLRQRFDRATDPWFYMHARDKANAHPEIVPTFSYLFRHDRGAFWSGAVFLKYYALPNNRFTRWLFNPIMTARAIYKAMLAVDSADGAIIQDLLLPAETSDEFAQYVAQDLKIWPIWICPIRKKAGEGDIKVSSRGKGALIFNFGVWGPTDPTPNAVYKTNRALEQKLRDLRGMKVPYAANFYTEDELRKKWHAEALPSMYDKVRRKQDQREAGDGKVSAETAALTWTETIFSIWPLTGLYQMFHALFG
ncbi:FAD-binding domain-containing protein [Pyrenochaeta sp. DS3sAY3a]|nr:FAD-binding domain-containing protein [Pyrenochaeta sp. DS3sAY3a]